jgi:cbb3-type cytochrome oxidase maturation protein
MNVLYFILPLSFLFAAGIMYVFIRATLSGQWDDLDTPAYRILFDDESVQSKGDPDDKQ